jgi:hypothetical protein
MATKAKNPVVTQPAGPNSKATARAATHSSCNAAAVIEVYGKSFGEQDLLALVDELSDSIKRVQGGDMKRCEAMLMGQAHALQSIFTNFSRRALKQEYQKNLESYFRMAMKAQNQCRMTLETLATIKNPPIVYAKQANIAHGPQQINNGAPAPAHTEKILNQSNELLEHQHGNTLDTGTAGAAAGHDPAMATLGAINGAEVARG